MERTRSDSKFRPIRKAVSRYGFVEKALREIKDQQDARNIQNNTTGYKKFDLSEVVMKTKHLTTSNVMGILRFTSGIKRIGSGQYIFDGEKIEVDIGTLEPQRL